MTIHYSVKGLDAFLNHLKTKSKEAEIATEKELERSALRIERTAKSLAAVDTGLMKKEIYSARLKKLTHKVVSPVHYSVYIDKGTRKMKAQPFMTPAVEQEAPVLIAKLKKLYGK